ncbi:MAG: serine O-acetyltransferase [Succinivibrio sp.]
MSNTSDLCVTAFWKELTAHAEEIVKQEPVLEDIMNRQILQCHGLDQSLARIISSNLASREVDRQQLFQVCMQAYSDEPELLSCAVADVMAVANRDPASKSLVRIMLFLKGPRVIEAFRISHWLWEHQRCDLASYLQSRISDVFAVDIHPAARIGKGLMFDHATNIVIGETAVIADTVSILHDVTLGGTGKVSGDRHPKVGRGVMIGAGAKVLGNIKIGDGAVVGAGSVVLRDVPAHTTVVGVPARVVGRPSIDMPSLDMDQTLSGSQDDSNFCPAIEIKQV